MLSCVDIRASLLWSVNTWTEGYSSEHAESHIMDLGMHPVLRKNSAYPVLSDQAELIANSIAGSLETQSVCLSLIH